MENKDATDWEGRFNTQKLVLLDAMSDLENYRSLVHRLKKENNCLRQSCQWAERQASKNKEELRAVILEEIQYGYRTMYQN